MILSQDDCDDYVVDALLFQLMLGAVAGGDADSGVCVLFCCVNRDVVLVTGP